MFDNSNPYTLKVETIDGVSHYYISFVDGQAIHRETEVTQPVYLEFLHFIKVERNLRRWDERHIEQFGMTDEMLCNRVLLQPKSAEEATLDSLRDEQLHLAIQSLPEIQRRRFTLYHESGLTYEQIAKIEGRRKSAICESVLRAEKKVCEKLKSLKI